MLEIGIPFSDPMADGPVIQDAATKALQNGMSLHRLFEELKDIRQDVEIPLILMGYLNPIFHYGFEAFCQSCADCGIDGVIIPDLPFRDYMETFKPIADRHGLKIIMLITPETSKERIRLIDRHTDGFIYMVSSAATTGAQKEFDRTKQAYFDRVNQMGLTHPRMIGFGISNRQTLESAQKHAAGAIIGSRAVVTKDVPPYTIVGGLPAKPIRRRYDEETAARLEKLRWWDWPEAQVRRAIPLLQAGDLDALEKLV